MQSATPEALVDDEAGRCGDKARPRPEQQLVWDDPDIRICPALPLISTDIVKFANRFLVPARPTRNFPKRLPNQRRAVEFAAHLLARLLGVGGLSAAVDARRDAGFGKIAYDLVTKPVPRHGENAGEQPANESRRDTLPPGSRLAESNIDQHSLHGASGWRRRHMGIKVEHRPTLMRPCSFALATASGLRDTRPVLPHVGRSTPHARRALWPASPAPPLRSREVPG